MPLKLTENKKSIITPLTYKHTPCLAETNGSKKEYYPSVLDKRGLHQIGDTVYFYTGAFISLGYSPDGVSKYYVCNNTQYHNPHTWTYDLTGGNVVDNEYVHSFTRTVYDTNDSMLGAEYNHPDCPYTKSLTVDPNTSITKRGYNFNCWVENSNTYSNASSHSTQIDAYFSAKWTPITYNISYNGNNGTVNVNLGSSEFPLSYNIESSPITFGSPSSWDRRGYTFAGWSPATIPTGSIDDKTVYAQWSLNSYPIYYDANGGTVNYSITPNNPSSYTVLDSGTFNAPSNISRTGYTFTGWSPSSYGPDQVGSFTTTANWTIINYKISYDANGGQVMFGYNLPSSYNIETPSFAFQSGMYRPGYSFSGWNPSGISQGSVGDKVVIAQWAINYYTATLNDELNGNSSKTFTVNDIPVSLPTQISEEEMTLFNGWEDTSDGSIITSLTSLKNYNLKANWKTGDFIFTNTISYMLGYENTYKREPDIVFKNTFFRPYVLGYIDGYKGNKSMGYIDNDESSYYCGYSNSYSYYYYYSKTYNTPESYLATYSSDEKYKEGFIKGWNDSASGREPTDNEYLKLISFYFHYESSNDSKLHNLAGYAYSNGYKKGQEVKRYESQNSYDAVLNRNNSLDANFFKRGWDGYKNGENSQGGYSADDFKNYDTGITQGRSYASEYEIYLASHQTVYANNFINNYIATRDTPNKSYEQYGFIVAFEEAEKRRLSNMGYTLSSIPEIHYFYKWFYKNESSSYYYNEYWGYSYGYYCAKSYFTNYPKTDIYINTHPSSYGYSDNTYIKTLSSSDISWYAKFPYYVSTTSLYCTSTNYYNVPYMPFNNVCSYGSNCGYDSSCKNSVIHYGEENSCYRTYYSCSRPIGESPRKGCTYHRTKHIADCKQKDKYRCYYDGETNVSSSTDTYNTSSTITENCSRFPSSDCPYNNISFTVLTKINIYCTSLSVPMNRLGSICFLQDGKEYKIFDVDTRINVD